jgi:hypothetical protein
MICQARFDRDCLQPFDVLVKLLSSLFNIVEARLYPLEPVSFLEAGRHLRHTFASNVLLECVHPIDLILSQVVPTEVNSSVILCFFIMSLGIFPIWDKKVSVGRRHVVSVLLVVKRIVNVIWVRVLNRLFNFFKVFLISPLLVKVGLLVARVSQLGHSTRVIVVPRVYQHALGRRYHLSLFKMMLFDKFVE